MKQLDAQDTTDIATAQLEPIDLSLSVLKEVGAQWLVDMAEYFSNNPQILLSVGLFVQELQGLLAQSYRKFKSKA
jgi:hypothetical protein